MGIFAAICLALLCLYAGYDFSQFSEHYDECKAAGGKIANVNRSYECWDAKNKRIIALGK